MARTSTSSSPPWDRSLFKKMTKSLSNLRIEGSPTQSRISPSIQRILRQRQLLLNSSNKSIRQWTLFASEIARSRLEVSLHKDSGPTSWGRYFERSDL